MDAPETLTAPATLAERAQLLCDSPVIFFNQSFNAMQTVDRQDLADLQLEALQQRFAQLRDRIPMLKMLADKQGIEKLDTVDDVVPLLFEHTMYKSYPPTLLENGRFAEINKFLSRLSTFDLSGIDVSACETIDDWMEVMDAESPLVLHHSSGTSGVMSFLPCSKREWDKHGEAIRVTDIQVFGEDASGIYDEPFNVIYPSFRTGGGGHVRTALLYAKHIAGTEERLFTAYPGRMSSDVLYLAAKIRAAQAKGDLHRLKISPRLLARKAEYEAFQREMPERLIRFFTEMAEDLKGQRVFFSGAQHLLLQATRIGQEKGLSHVFAPSSVLSTGGDVKDGATMPDDWREQVCDFVGVKRIRTGYGMSEVKARHNKCANGHYHFAPWVIPFILDPDTSKLMPRKGRTTGRMAMFDLGAETRWGGFISGDEVSIEWDQPCGCGQTTVWAHDGIQRFSAKRGGDDKINCAATEGAHKEAMSFLTNL